MAGQAGLFNIEVNQHATYNVRLTWMTTGSTPAPIDTTDHIVVLQVRAEKDSPNVLYQASTGNEKIVCGGASGHITIKIPAEDTSQMRFREAFYDVIIKRPNGDTIRFIEGTFTVRLGVSKID